MDRLVAGGTAGRHLSPLVSPSASGQEKPHEAATCGLCSASCPVPVLLVSCGHRFCLGCLERFWQRIPSSERPCPTCTTAVRQQQLQLPSSPLQPVPCDRCPAYAPCSARWSCLTCGESYCPEHFQPHIVLEEGDMSQHRVCDAAGEESMRMRWEMRPGRRCPEHRDRAVELYCGACRVCVCPLCPLVGTHKGHPVTLLQEEALQMKTLLSRCLEQLDQKRNHVLGNIQHIEQAADDLKARALENKDSLTGKFTELRLLLDEEEKLAKKFIEDKTKLALWAYEGQTQSCQEHINTISAFSASIRSISEKPDDIKLIQEYVAAEKEMQRHMSPAELWHPIPVTFEHVENYYTSFTEAMKSSFEEPLIKRLQQGLLTSNAASKQKPGSLIKTKLFVDRSLFLKYARCPTLDSDTMHPRLRLSDDRLTVYCAWFGRFNSHHVYRFDKLLQVMSRDCYLSGSHYWEVNLLQAGQGWWIGITYPSIQRKGDSEFSRLGWNSGSWCIKRYDHEYWAFHKGERTALKLNDPPEKVGIFLDYESGVLSFFDVTSDMKHIHTFRCRFTEPIYPALRLWDGMMTMCRLNEYYKQEVAK